MVPKMNIKIWLVLSSCFLWEAQAFSQVEVHFDEIFKQEKIQIEFREQTYRTKLDDSGLGLIQVADTLAPGYAVLYGPRSVNMFYLVPGKRQGIIRQQDKGIKFTGTAKAINEYLNGPFLNGLNPGYEKNEEDFMEKWEQLSKRLETHLDSLQLPSDFKKSERKRLYYVACNLLLNYPLHHSRALNLKSYSPQDGYYRKLSEMIKEDPSSHEYWEYRQVFRDWIRMLGERKKSQTGKPLDKLRCELEYIQNHVRDMKLAEYLVDACMSEYVRYFGAEGVEEFLSFYKKTVKNERRKTEFLQTYAQYVRLEQGRKAPNFSLSDMNGNKMNLSDWLGYYVYLDVWATWCGPCCRELPEFHKLQEQFKDKPIRFVSISIDADETAWKNRIEKDYWEGIQLHVNEGNSFQEDYKISFIPRFILIDREGRIIDAQMSRPSDPKTVETLSSLLLASDNKNPEQKGK